MNLTLAKRTFLAVILLLGMKYGVSWAKIENSKMVEYTHKTERFSLKIPSDWDIREDMTYQLFKIPLLAIRPLENENDNFRENINVTVDKISPTLQTNEYFNGSLKAMSSTNMLKSFKKVESGDLKDGIPNAKYLIYTHTGEDGSFLKVIVFFYTKAGKGYSLTCTSTEKSFSNYLNLFLQIGKSFRLANI